MIKRNQEEKLQALIARQTKLKTDLEGAKKPMLPAIHTPMPDKVEHVMTPRTAQRYALCKTVSTSPKLTVKPLGRITKKRTKKRPGTALVD